MEVPRQTPKRSAQSEITPHESGDSASSLVDLINSARESHFQGTSAVVGSSQDAVEHPVCSEHSPSTEACARYGGVIRDPSFLNLIRASEASENNGTVLNIEGNFDQDSSEDAAHTPHDEQESDPESSGSDFEFRLIQAASNHTSVQPELEIPGVRIWHPDGTVVCYPPASDDQGVFRSLIHENPTKAQKKKLYAAMFRYHQMELDKLSPHLAPIEPNDYGVFSAFDRTPSNEEEVNSWAQTLQRNPTHYKQWDDGFDCRIFALHNRLSGASQPMIVPYKLSGNNVKYVSFYRREACYNRLRTAFHKLLDTVKLHADSHTPPSIAYLGKLATAFFNGEPIDERFDKSNAADKTDEAAIAIDECMNSSDSVTRELALKKLEKIEEQAKLQSSAHSATINYVITYQKSAWNELLAEMDEEIRLGRADECKLPFKTKSFITLGIFLQDTILSNEWERLRLQSESLDEVKFFHSSQHPKTLSSLQAETERQRKLNISDVSNIAAHLLSSPILMNPGEESRVSPAEDSSTELGGKTSVTEEKQHTQIATNHTTKPAETRPMLMKGPQANKKKSSAGKAKGKSVLQQAKSKKMKSVDEKLHEAPEGLTDAIIFNVVKSSRDDAAPETSFSSHIANDKQSPPDVGSAKQEDNSQGIKHESEDDQGWEIVKAKPPQKSRGLGRHNSQNNSQVTTFRNRHFQQRQPSHFQQVAIERHTPKTYAVNAPPSQQEAHAQKGLPVTGSDEAGRPEIRKSIHYKSNDVIKPGPSESKLTRQPKGVVGVSRGSVTAPLVFDDEEFPAMPPQSLQSVADTQKLPSDSLFVPEDQVEPGDLISMPIVDVVDAGLNSKLSLQNAINESQKERVQNNSSLMADCNQKDISDVKILLEDPNVPDPASTSDVVEQTLKAAVHSIPGVSQDLPQHIAPLLIESQNSSVVQTDVSSQLGGEETPITIPLSEPIAVQEDGTAFDERPHIEERTATDSEVISANSNNDIVPEEGLLTPENVATGVDSTPLSSPIKATVTKSQVYEPLAWAGDSLLLPTRFELGLHSYSCPAIFHGTRMEEFDSPPPSRYRSKSVNSESDQSEDEESQGQVSDSEEILDGTTHTSAATLTSGETNKQDCLDTTEALECTESLPQAIQSTDASTQSSQNPVSSLPVHAPTQPLPIENDIIGSASYNDEGRGLTTPRIMNAGTNSQLSGYVEFQCAFCHENIIPSSEKPMILCSGCGPQSSIRYCSKACLLVDAYDHISYCTNLLMSERVANTTHLDRSIYEINMLRTVENFRDPPAKYRQKMFSVYCKHGSFPKLLEKWTKKYPGPLPGAPPLHQELHLENQKITGDYHVFSSRATAFSPRLNDKADVIFTISLHADDPMKQILSRCMNACFVYRHYPIVEFLFRMVRSFIMDPNLFSRFPATRDQITVLAEFNHQFIMEFGFVASQQFNPNDFFIFDYEVAQILPQLVALESQYPILQYWFQH